MGAQRSLAAPGGSRVRENPHLGAFAAPRHAITETSAGGREASKRSHWLIFSALSDVNSARVNEESGKSDGPTGQRPARRRGRVGAPRVVPSNVSPRAAASFRPPRAGSPPANRLF